MSRHFTIKALFPLNPCLCDGNTYIYIYPAFKKCRCCEKIGDVPCAACRKGEVAQTRINIIKCENNSAFWLRHY
jgi:hypothetical protein